MPWQGWYAAAAEGITKASLKKQGTEVSAYLAREFLDSWLAAFPDALSPPPAADLPPSPLESSEDEAEEQDSDEEQLFDDEDGESDEDDEFDPVEGDRFDDEEVETDGESYGEGEDGDEGDESEGEPQPDAGSEEPDDEPEDDDGDVGGDSGGGGGEFAPVENDRLDDRKLIDPEPNVDDLFKRAAERNKSPVRLPPCATAAVSDMSKWTSMKGVDENVYEHLRKSAGMAALRSQLTRVLRAPELCGWDGGAVGGRFDGRRAPRMFAGSERVFKRRWVSPGVDTAVSVIVDLSSSMWGNRATAARDLAFAIADVVEGARCDVEVMGFRHSQGASGGDHFGKGGAPTRLDGRAGGGGWENTGSGAVYVGSSRSELVLAKSFGRKLKQAARAIASLPDLVGGGTPDYETVRAAVERLGAMPHQRKLCIVITDGFGDEADMRKLCDAAPNLFGVDIVGFGIGCDPRQFNTVYPIGTAVTLDTMGKSTLKGVIKQLELRGERRVA
jgi:cobalamin biosynthesis protein CobT